MLKVKLAAALAALLFGPATALAQNLNSESRCLQGEAVYCYFAADGLYTADRDKARKYAGMACFDGYVRACRFLISDYYGKDAAASRDGLRAAELYCEAYAGNPQGDGAVADLVPAACYTAGYAYRVGDGIRQDVNRGNAYLRDAASLGGKYGLMSQCMLNGSSASACLDRYG